MKLLLIFPKWPKLAGQTPFTLPPLGIIQVAACVPPEIEVTVVDENVQPVDLDADVDLVGIGIMLTCQANRGYELADAFRARGRTVVLGGLHVALCPDEAEERADAIVVGEAEGVFEKLLEDFAQGAMKSRYTRDGLADVTTLPNPRRSLYDKKKHYSYKGFELVDLVETSRGCRFNCYPCCTPYLGGRQHRIRPLDHVLSDLDQCSENLFIVDNSLEQNVEYEKTLFRAMAGLGKSWVSHPISCEPEVLRLAADAGCWYVYHAIYTISDKIRDRIKMYHDHGIGVEGTILLGMDDHDEDFIRRFIDFLLTIELDLAEFTILTPFPQTRVYADLESEGRIINRDWSKYNAGEVVFRPRLIEPDRLSELFQEAWTSFHRETSQELRMSKLLLQRLRSGGGLSRRERRARRTK
jgi:radical SAM superfamily enzyme YgiQ (UPF0313 family)